ncbi:MAG: pyruvate kinase [Coriobacteriaceae bacterium]|nr:pyruvate kinase [Coriobacteriaceae bacterium]
MYKRTKIVCTMGPACDNDETIREMIKAGMNVARFNFSHGSYEEHQVRIERVRRIAKELGQPVGILLDTKGPEVRTGLLKDHAKVEVKAGDKIVVTAQPTTEDWLGDASHISLDYLQLPSEAEAGSIILIDDGLVGLEVESIDGQDMTCKVLNNGLIGERKGVNIPNVDISLPAVTERDRQDILFGLTQNIDYIAASFIRSGAAVDEIRELCRANGGEHVTIFPKIECALGVEKFDEILEASDGIMVARGDLGIEIAPELVPHIQKEIIAKCNAAYKPVITATQMLDSMQNNPRPTRAEVADVANAIYDGTDAVMLSGESAAGKYPVEAVKMQASIALETEKYLPAHAELSVAEDTHGTRLVNNVVGLSAVNMATTVGAKCITVPTTTGRTARLISHFRPNMPICAFSRNDWAVQQMIMYWGVIPHKAEITQGTVNGTIVKAIETAKELGYVEEGDLTVATAGDPRLSVQLEDKVSSTNVAYVAQVR